MHRTRAQRAAASRHGWEPRKSAKQAEAGFAIRQLLYVDPAAVVPHFSETRVERALEHVLAKYREGTREREVIRRIACRTPAALRMYVKRLGPEWLTAQIRAAGKANAGS